MKPRNPVATDINILKRDKARYAVGGQVRQEQPRTRWNRAHPAGWLALITVVACWLFEIPLHATMVVILGTQQRIVIAADSRLTYTTPVGQTGKVVDTGCKIAIDGPLILGMAGNIAGPLDGTKGLDVRAIWQGLTGRPESVFERARRLMTALTLATVETTLETPNHAAVIGFLGANPAAAVIPFVTSPTSPHPVVSNAEIQAGSTMEPLVVLLGDGIEGVDGKTISSRLKNPMTEREIIAFAEQMLTDQAKRIKTVGGAIDIAVLGRTGAAYWHQAKPECKQTRR